MNKVENIEFNAQESTQKLEFTDYENFDPTTLKNYISKKTQRGRKTKCPLPKEIRCSICLEYEEYSKEKLTYCSICQAPLHLSCYHLSVKDLDNYTFTCERCLDAVQSHIDIKNYSCFICGESDGILAKNQVTGKYYHTLCLRLIPELYEDAKSMNDICRENIRKWRYKNSCKYCQQRLSKNKAVIKCANPKCKDYYHIPCAIEKGMIFSTNYLYKYYDLENYKNNMSVPFYCSCHNKRLAAAYRKDVVFNENINENKVDEKSSISGDFLNFLGGVSKESSTFIDLDEEENDSEINFFLEKKRHFSYDSSNDDTTTSVVNSEIYEDKYEDKYEENLCEFNYKSNALDLDFNKIALGDDELFKQISKDLCYNTISNISPKEKIPLEFIYGSCF